MAVKGPRGALFMWVQDLGHFVCYCWKKNVVYKNHVNMCLSDLLTWKLYVKKYTILGECVVSSKIGPCLKSRLTMV